MSLPDLIPLSGDWNEYLNKVYAQFHADIVASQKRFRGKPVRARYNPATDGKGFSFWHVISEGSQEEERTPDLRRCERIAWIGWVLTQADNSDERIKILVSVRTTRRGTTERTLLWYEEAEYVVVLEERDVYFHLVTAYPVTGKRAEKLRIEWVQSQK